MSRSKLRSLACSRVAGYDLEVETRKWDRHEGAGMRARVPLPRAERLCRLCDGGVGDELHVAAECPAYAAVRQSLSATHACLRVWEVGDRQCTGRCPRLRCGSLCFKNNTGLRPSCVIVVCTVGVDPHPALDGIGVTLTGTCFSKRRPAYSYCSVALDGPKCKGSLHNTAR